MRVYIVLLDYGGGEEVINVFKNEMDAEDYAKQRDDNPRYKEKGWKHVVESYEVID